MKLTPIELFAAPHPKLTEATLRTKSQAGDTPLHRAARSGRLHEIPAQLLKADLFMEKDNTGWTPLHAAAAAGHLDQVPIEFLTRDALLALETPPKAPQGFFTTGSGGLARTETVLHIAARFGHADQIPKCFLTPEYLLIEARGYRETVLEHLVKSKRLDLLPRNYANSEAWNLKDRNGQTPREILGILLQREAQLAADSAAAQVERTAFISRVRSERAAWRPTIQTEPSKLLPVFSDESLRAIEVKSTDGTKAYIVNLLEYTCTCPLCLEIHSGVPARDFGRLCKHIILALRRQKLVAQLPPIAQGIVQNGKPDAAFGIYPGRFANDLYGNPIYVGGMDDNGWISVVAHKRRSGVNYYRFGYHVSTGRWCRIHNSTGVFTWTKPQVDESILH